jgi:hypothetical protein
MADTDTSSYILRYNLITLLPEYFNGADWYTQHAGASGPTTLTGDVTGSGVGSVATTAVSAGGGTGTFLAGSVQVSPVGATLLAAGYGLILGPTSAGIAIQDSNDIDWWNSAGTMGAYAAIFGDETNTGLNITSGGIAGGTSPYIALRQGTNQALVIDKNDSTVILSSSASDPSTIVANASAQLEVDSTTKGVLLPRMTTTQKNAIASPATGLLVFDTTLAALCEYNGSAWVTLSSGPAITSLTGDGTATGPGAAALTVVSAGGGTGSFAAGTIQGPSGATLNIKAGSAIQNAISLEGASGGNILSIDASTGRVAIGGTSPGYKLDVNGQINCQQVFVDVGTLTGTGTVTPNAQGGYEIASFTVSGSLTINGPINGLDGQKLTLRIINDGSHSVTLATGSGNFKFGTTFTSYTNSVSLIDYIGVIYDSTANLWHVVSLSQGF